MNSKIIAYAVMDGDEVLRKTGSSTGRALAIYATWGAASKAAEEHRRWSWVRPRPGATVVPLGVVE